LEILEILVFLIAADKMGDKIFDFYEVKGLGTTEETILQRPRSTRKHFKSMKAKKTTIWRRMMMTIIHVKINPT